MAAERIELDDQKDESGVGAALQLHSAIPYFRPKLLAFFITSCLGLLGYLAVKLFMTAGLLWGGFPIALLAFTGISLCALAMAGLMRWGFLRQKQTRRRSDSNLLYNILANQRFILSNLLAMSVFALSWMFGVVPSSVLFSSAAIFYPLVAFIGLTISLAGYLFATSPSIRAGAPSKFTLIFSTLSFMAAAGVLIWLVATKANFFAVFSGFQLAGWLVFGIGMTLVVMRLMKYRLRGDIQSEEKMGRIQRAGDRWILLVATVALSGMTIAFAFLLGVTSIGFLASLAATGCWIFGQTAMRGNEKNPVPSYLQGSRLMAVILKEPAATEKSPLLGLQRSLEDDEKKAGEIDETKVADPKIAASLSYFRVSPETGHVWNAFGVTTDILSCASLVTMATLGGLSAAQGNFKDSLFSNGWMQGTFYLLNAVGTLKDIKENRATDGETRTCLRRSLEGLEKFVSWLTLAAVPVSAIAKVNHHAFGENSAAIQVLSSYGFVAGMTLSTLKALYDFVIAHEDCSPRTLLEKKIKAHNALPESDKDKQHLRKEILAIARVKSGEIAENISQFFASLDFAVSMEEAAANHGDPTLEEILFVKTLFQMNDEKREEAIKRFLIGAMLTVCFVLFTFTTATTLVSSFGGGTNALLIFSALIKIFQLLSRLCKKWHTPSPDQIRDQFLKMTEIGEQREGGAPFGWDRTQAILAFNADEPVAEIKFEEGANFETALKNAGLNPDDNGLGLTEKAKYKIAYCLRKQYLYQSEGDQQQPILRAHKVEDFLRCLTPAQLDAALDEFIIQHQSVEAVAERKAAHPVTQTLRGLMAQLPASYGVLHDNVDLRTAALKQIGTDFFKAKRVKAVVQSSAYQAM